MPITPSPAVLRACEVLQSAWSSIRPESFTVSELARAVGVPRATCDAILQALAVQRFVTRSADDRRYELGPASIALGEAARIANPGLRAAKAEAERLARELGACVSVCIHDGHTARVVEAFDFGPLFALRARVGQAIPLVPPFGAVFVAWNDDDAEGWIARAGDSLEAGERDRYRRALGAMRRRGYSVSIATPRPAFEERIETLVGSPESDDAAASARRADPRSDARRVPASRSRRRIGRARGSDIGAGLRPDGVRHGMSPGAGPGARHHGHRAPRSRRPARGGRDPRDSRRRRRQPRGRSFRTCFRSCERKVSSSSFRTSG